MRRVKELIKQNLPPSVYRPFLSPYHLGRAVIANIKYGFPARKLKVIGITGTNGKTTTANFIASILEAAGYKVGLSTTATFQIAKKRWDNSLNMTVTDPFQLQALLKRMKVARVDWVVLEVTSHSLTQHRLWGIPIEVAVMTNLSEDHLDYHKTMEKYAATKARLMKRARRDVVLNRDDKWFNYFARSSNKAHYTYGTNVECDVRLEKAQLKPEHSTLRFQYGTEKLSAQLNLAGKINVYNAMAAATVGLGLELDQQAVTKGLQTLKGIPGRQEIIKVGQRFKVIVDYAHDTEAFRQLFKSLRPLTKGRLIAVFGGAGDRDPKRWPGMGKAAGQLTDIAIITDDEPHSEDPSYIRRTILKAAHEPGKAKVIEKSDRREAFKTAFKLAKPNDIVMLLCLGHQKYRAMNEGMIPWDDRKVARELLKVSLKK